MAADTATVTAISDAASTAKDTMIGAGGAVLPFAGTLLALTAGWRFARKFLHG